MIREFDIQGTQVWSGRRDMGSGWPDPFISQTPHSVVMVGVGGCLEEGFQKHRAWERGPSW